MEAGRRDAARPACRLRRLQPRRRGHDHRADRGLLVLRLRVRRCRRVPLDRRRQDLAAGRGVPVERPRLQGHRRPQGPEQDLSRHGRRPLPLHRRRAYLHKRAAAGRRGRRRRAARLHRRSPQEGLRPREHGHGRGRPRRRWARRRRRRLARRPQGERRRHVQSPGNGLYASDAGDPGSFQRIAVQGLPKPGDELGRIELAGASGPDQNHQLPLRDRPGRGQVPRRGARARRQRSRGRPVPDVLAGSTRPRTSARPGARRPRPSSSRPLARAARSRPWPPWRRTTAPGIQAWYNRRIAPDPTRPDAAGVPTRLTFGLEEVWAERDRRASPGRPAPFKVIGRYYAGETCQHLNLAAARLPDQPPRPRLRHDDAPGPARRGCSAPGRRRDARGRQRRRRLRAGAPRRRGARPTTSGAAAPTAASTRCSPTTPRSPRTGRSTPACRTTARSRSRPTAARSRSTAATAASPPSTRTTAQIAYEEYTYADMARHHRRRQVVDATSRRRPTRTSSSTRS